jgi:polygalacturonase
MELTDNTVIFQQVIDNCSLLGGGTIMYLQVRI